MSEVVVIVRVRGRTHVKPDIEDTLKYLGLTRKNHATIINVNKSEKGMVNKINDYVTWGEITEKTTEELLKSRGRLSGGKPVDDSYVKDNSSFEGISQFAKALAKGEAKLKDIEGLKRVFRLNPPVKGFERGGIKAPFTKGGVLGYRGEKINELILRMI